MVSHSNASISSAVSGSRDSEPVGGVARAMGSRLFKMQVLRGGPLINRASRADAGTCCGHKPSVIVMALARIRPLFGKGGIGHLPMTGHAAFTRCSRRRPGIVDLQLKGGQPSPPLASASVVDVQRRPWPMPRLRRDRIGRHGRVCNTVSPRFQFDANYARLYLET